MINKTILQGRLTADIELRQTQSGIYFTEFTVAWSEKYKDIETKCFMRCKAWRNTAEFLAKYFEKGQEILIEGRTITEQWEKEGQTQSRLICDIDKIHFCGSKSANATNAQIQAIGEFEQLPEDEDLPF